jgi:hypothetical protein
VRARAFDGSTWSAESDAWFRPPPDLTNLVLGEIMYHPAAAWPGTEFIEFVNIGRVPLDLTGVRFAAGLTFEFPPQTIVAAGGRVLVVENRAAFEAAYGPTPGIAGAYQPSNLSNGGELLQVVDDRGTVLESLTFDDVPPWPTEADGAGHSLVRIAPAARLDPALASSWRGSVAVRGNPGTSDAATFSGTPDGLLAYALAGTGLPWLSILSNGQVNFGYRRNLAADDAVFTVETSADLQAWRADPAAVEWLATLNHGDGTASLAFRAPPGSSRGFFRLKVTQRPPTGP